MMYTESRRNQEDRGELDPQEEAIPEEIKNREVVLGNRGRAGLLLLPLFSNSGATDIVFVTVLQNGWDSNCVVHWSPRIANGHCLNILLFWQQSTVALVFQIGTCFEVSLICPPFPTHPHPFSCLRGC